MPLGVYVHIPFCADRCDYCDFATWTDRGHLDRRVRGRLRGRRPPADGGIGAPGDERLLRGRDAVADPGRGSRPHPRRDHAGARRRGDGRVQSGLGRAGAARDLRGGRREPALASACSRCSRTCSPSSAAPTTRPASSARCSGARRRGVRAPQPGPHLRHRRASRSTTGAARLDGALALEPDHVSAYALTVEPGTPLGRDIAARRAPRARRRRPGREVRDRRRRPARRRVRVVRDLELGPARAARAGTTSSTGTQGDYLAIGAAAHGHLGGRRAWNLRTPERYIAAVAVRAPRSRPATKSSTGRAGARRRCCSRVRTRAGIAVTPGSGPSPAELAADGLVEPTRRPDRLVLTRRGRLLASEVTVRLLAAAPRRQADRR